MKLLLEHNPRHNVSLEDLANEAIYVVNKLVVMASIVEVINEWAVDFIKKYEETKSPHVKHEGFQS